ncbi:MAG: hypothetical protein QOE64_1791 [Frankiales bacterium]|nr:hypothetical protein [Frankiales bacterium]
MTLPDLLRQQAQGCRELGSPLYGRLLSRVADDVERGGVFAGIFAGHEDDRARSAVGLRLLGAVHRLVLEGRAPDLAAHYPSVGGVPGDGLWEVFRAAAVEHEADVRALLEIPPQTNEVGRAAALVGGLMRLHDQTGLPIRLLEIGSSGGLNLNADRFRYDLSPARCIGDRHSPVRLDRPWKGDESAWPTGEIPPIVERGGCDPDPVDTSTAEGQLTVTSYVWADQVTRFERLRAALDVAQRHPPGVDRATAGEWLRDRLRPEPIVVTVLWHSVVWQYLSDDERAAVNAVLASAGAAATASAPVAHLSLEPGGKLYVDKFAFVVTLRTWPHAPEPQVIATAAGHGPPVVWR